MKRWCRLLVFVTGVSMLVMPPAVGAVHAATKPAPPPASRSVSRKPAAAKPAAKAPAIAAHPAGKAQPASSPRGQKVSARTPARGRAAARPPVIALEHLTTHAAFSLRPDLPSGGFSAQQMKSLSALLRCHHTGQRHAINRRLAEILYSTARHYHNAKLFIVAGYRAPRIAQKKGNPKSPHKRGVACDFQVSGVANEEVRDFLRGTFRNIGVGYYPNSGFIHVDVGRKRDAYWIDYSSPGQPARYTAQTEVTEQTAPRPLAAASGPSDNETESE
ncbi:MAG: DUF882 domain-containing protein [Polyangia bacterium]